MREYTSAGKYGPWCHAQSQINDADSRGAFNDTELAVAWAPVSMSAVTKKVDLA